VILATPHALWTLRAGGGNVAASGGNVAASVPYTLVETPTKVTLKSIIAAPWGADGAEEILALTDSADGTARRPFLTALALFSPRTDGTFQLRWQGFPAKWQPWRIMACDADADGQPDVALGVRKTARYDPHLDNRPFIYSWNGETLLPKWRGSRLSRPFTDFALGDLDGDGADELVAIERTKGKEGREGEGRGGKGREGERGREGNMETRDSGTLGTSGTSGEAEYALRGYEWNGFGYTAAWDSPSYSALRDLHGADLNHDGTTEVLALVTTQEREGVVVFGVRGESLAPLWSSPLGPPLTGLAWGDVDGDGPVEIVAATPTAWRVWQPGL
jgi:hypothetical protein